MRYTLLLICLLSLPVMAAEKESTETQGYVAQKQFSVSERLTARKKGTTTTTTGTVNGKYVRLKTRETATGTLTTGTIGNDYVRIKEKKDKDG